MNQNLQLQLWNKMLKGDLGAFEQIYTLFHSDLYHYAFKITNTSDIAEDVVQGTFVDLWNYRQQVGAVQSPKFYLIRSLRNQCLKLLKKNKHFVNLANINAFNLTIQPEELRLVFFTNPSIRSYLFSVLVSY